MRSFYKKDHTMLGSRSGPLVVWRQARLPGPLCLLKVQWRFFWGLEAILLVEGPQPEMPDPNPDSPQTPKS